MEYETTYWHRLAQLFLNRELSLQEIGKALIIVTAVGMIEDRQDAIRIGFNVLDNSELHDALVFGLIHGQRNGNPIAFTDMAKLLNVSDRVIGASVGRLVASGRIAKEDRGRAGSVYTIQPNQPAQIPVWILKFTEALAELNDDPKLKAQVVAECESIGFMRGMQVLKDELRSKFYRRGSGDKKP